MALPDPRNPLPAIYVARQSFRLDYMQVTQGARGGSYDVTDVGPALWRSSLDTIYLDGAAYGEVSAWESSLRGGLVAVLLYDYFRPFPITYPNGWAGMTKAVGGAAFTGTGTLTTATSETLTVAGLPANFTLAAGDYISVAYGDGSRHLHRVLETANSSVAGGEGIWTVEPHVRTGWTAGDVVTLEKAPAKFLVRAEAADGRVEGIWATFRFTAVQTLKGS